jgi:hypothetical protein
MTGLIPKSLEDAMEEILSQEISGNQEETS